MLAVELFALDILQGTDSTLIMNSGKTQTPCLNNLLTAVYLAVQCTHEDTLCAERKELEGEGGRDAKLRPLRPLRATAAICYTVHRFATFWSLTRQHCRRTTYDRGGVARMWFYLFFFFCHCLYLNVQSHLIGHHGKTVVAINTYASGNHDPKEL